MDLVGAYESSDGPSSQALHHPLLQHHQLGSGGATSDVETHPSLNCLTPRYCGSGAGNINQTPACGQYTLIHSSGTPRELMMGHFQVQIIVVLLILIEHTIK